MQAVVIIPSLAILVVDIDVILVALGLSALLLGNYDNLRIGRIVDDLCLADKLAAGVVVIVLNAVGVNRRKLLNRGIVALGGAQPLCSS